MRTVNNFTVLGNVGSVKTFGKIAKVSIGTNRVWTDNGGDRQQRTDWVEITILDEKQAKWVSDNVETGQPTYAEGRIALNSFGEGDNRRYQTDLIATVFNVFPKG